MKVCVTGGSGFLGRHLVRRLLDDENISEVRVLCRNPDPALKRLGARLFPGSILEPGELEYAFEGVHAVFHLAGKVDRDPDGSAHTLFELHVTGTRNVLDVAQATDVQRIIYASTSGTVGVSTTPQLIDDDAPYAENIVKDWPYYQSKLYAEKVVRDAVERDGVNAVILRPTLLLGPEDERISSTTDVLRFLQGKMPAITSGGLSIVDVRDAAEAFHAALTHGEPGATYLLGSANLTVKDFFSRLARISGKPEPRVTLSGRATQVSAGILGALGRDLRERLDVDPQSLDMGRHYWYIDWRRAIDEIQFRPRDPGETLYDTVHWLQQNVLKVEPVSWERDDWSFDHGDADHASGSAPRANIREISSRWTQRAESLVRRAAEVAQNVTQNVGQRIIEGAARGAVSDELEGEDIDFFGAAVSSADISNFTGVSSAHYTSPGSGHEVEELRDTVREQLDTADADALQAALWAFRRMQN